MKNAEKELFPVRKNEIIKEIRTIHSTESESKKLEGNIRSCYKNQVHLQMVLMHFIIAASPRRW